MATSAEIKAVRNSACCSLSLAKTACEYSETHTDCSPMGYIRAVHFGGYKNEKFEDTVRRLSKE